MKRIFAIVLALCFALNIAASSFIDSSLSPKVYAAKAKNTKETSTEAEASSPTASESEHASYYNLSDLPDQPGTVAESAILMDATTGAVLFQKDADTKRYPASITKVMTALLVIENCKMDDVITFSDSAVNGVEAGSSSAGIPVGAQLTVEETLYAMMLVSANEAAAALAEYVSGSVGDFAKLMTARAKELGCTHTNFMNPHGLPDEKHITTANDMALILKQALQYDEFRKVAGTINYTISARNGISEPIELWNHAKLLRESSEFYYEYAEGAKTGFTQAALNTLVSYAKKGDVELICVVLKDHGAENSYKDSITLYNWGFKQVKGMRPLSEYNLNEGLEASPDLDKATLKKIKNANPSFDKDYYLLVKQSIDTANLSESFELAEDQSDGTLGYININYDGERIGRCPVKGDTSQAVAADEEEDSSDEEVVKKSSISSKILKSVKTILVILGCILIIMLLIVVIVINYMKNKKRKQRQENLARKIHQDAGNGRPRNGAPRNRGQAPQSRSSRNGNPVASRPRSGNTPPRSNVPGQMPTEGQPRQRRRRSERPR